MDFTGVIDTRIDYCLRGVIGQRLLPPIAGHRRELAAEVLVATEAVRRAVVEGADAERLTGLAAAGAVDGTISLDQALATLVDSGKVSRADAIQCTADPLHLEQLLGTSPDSGQSAKVGHEIPEIEETLATTEHYKVVEKG